MEPGIEERRARLKRGIERIAFVRGEDSPFVAKKTVKKSGWIFDIKKMLLSPDVLDDLGALFWRSFAHDRSIQIGGLESAAIPLVTGLVMHGFKEGGRTSSSGFFIRKSRKRDGLLKMIEGTLHEGVPIVLVDDALNTGKTFIRQVEILERAGYKVEALWVVVRYRSLDQYRHFTDKGIKIHSLFTLDDFAETLETHLLEPVPDPAAYVMPYRTVWRFSAPEPSYQYVVPKSDPVMDDARIFMGSDTGAMWALGKHDGAVAWKFQAGRRTKGKGIWSSPAVHAGTVFFGAYDGNVYALDAVTGKRKWVNLEADWVGSSPALAADLGLLFIGLEFGLWKRRGGIAAMDMKTGKTAWRFDAMPCFTHSSPLYIKRHRQVAIGSNDGAIYLFDAKNGKLVWKHEGPPLTEEELGSGFSRFDIKESLAYDDKRDTLIVGRLDGALLFLERQSGKLLHEFKAESAFFSTPLVHKRTVIASSTDKYVYCIDLDTFAEKWRWYGGARIFSSPAFIEGSIYVGANTGRLTELDPETGTERSFLTLTERITNKVAYDGATKRFFVPTFANELYCVEKKKPA